MATPFVPFNPGTITVTNGSVNFTGSGTSFLSYEVDDAIIVDGNLCRIDTIASNTAGTFALVYPGTSGAGKAYDWLPSSDVTRALTLYASFQRLLVGGNLAAEAALDGTGGNWLSYFTGAGAKALTAFGAAARSLLGLTAAANKLAYYSSSSAAALTDFFAWGRSLLGLTMAADKVPYGTDANTMALMTVTAAARGLLDDVDVATMRATLGTRLEAQVQVVLSGLPNHDITIPSWANTVEIVLYNVSPSALATISLFLTGSGSPEASGYSGVITTNGVNAFLSSAFTVAAGVAAASAVYGKLILKRINSTTWEATSDVVTIGTASAVKLVGGKGTTGSTTGARLAVNTGTFASGSLRVFFHE
jgi:hypothetical protein